YKYGFAKLLKILNDLPGEFKIRFLTNHPKDMTDDVINAIATLPKIKKEIHLPLQSGSDKILKAMNRPYTAEEYLRLVKSLKSKVHKVKITTDIIVGFPGETEENFQKTVEVCKKVGFDLAYINKYSPRKGTAAYKLGDPIIWAEKQRRWRILNELINKI
ncbi:tRNA (N6-isopentenyl adenosine(37)-C2)-methylthiotransferase MiaB, partial [Candidatus Berkelbacteria bacterium CG23_combo_of_CG06-09_8_20_14_all_41_73]